MAPASRSVATQTAEVVSKACGTDDRGSGYVMVHQSPTLPSWLPDPRSTNASVVGDHACVGGDSCGLGELCTPSACHASHASVAVAPGGRVGSGDQASQPQMPQPRKRRRRSMGGRGLRSESDVTNSGLLNTSTHGSSSPRAAQHGRDVPPQCGLSVAGLLPCRQPSVSGLRDEAVGRAPSCVVDARKESLEAVSSGSPVAMVPATEKVEPGVLEQRTQLSCPQPEAEAQADVPKGSGAAEAERKRPRGVLIAKVGDPDGNEGDGEKALYVSGLIEGCKVRFLIDTGAEITVIGSEVVGHLPRSIRMAFLERSYTLVMASGHRVTAQGPVLCKLTIAGRTVIEPVCSLPSAKDTILGMPALKALGCCVTVAGVEVLNTPPVSAVNRIQGAQIFRVRATEPMEILPRHEVLIAGRIVEDLAGQTVLVSPRAETSDTSRLLIAHTVGVPQDHHVCVRLCNTSEQKAYIQPGQLLAEAQVVQVLDDGTVRATPDDRDGVPEHVKDLFDRACANGALTPSAKPQLQELLKKYSQLFAENDTDLGRTTLVQHDIVTGDSPPLRQPPRRVMPALQDEFEKELERMQAAGVIEPGQSAWASPVVLVRKKDGSLRFCVDYRRLNAVTRFDAYPLPRIDDTLEALGGTKFFSTLDLISGYWQVGLSEDAKRKAAFTTRNGLFLWNVMPFGLCNAPSTFERLMETVLRGLQWQQCLVYLDDVIVFAKTEEDMLSRLDTVFGRLLGAGLKLKPRKCALFSTKTEYLGHVVSESGIKVNPDKVRAVKEWPVPESKREVRSFLGTASYYRRFVPGFATVAAPLHHVASPKADWQWTDECQRAFEELKDALSTAPVLAFPVKEAPYILDTDASLTGTGAVLSQVVNGREMVLGYASESLSHEERNYCVTRRELLAVIKALRHFRPYLYGRDFLIRTDHSSLRWLVSFKEPQDQMARWLHEISQYQGRYTIEHRPGDKHGNADGLSRIPCRQCKREDCSSAALQPQPPVRLLQIESTWSAVELCAAQKADPDICDILEAVTKGEKPVSAVTEAWSRAARRYLADWDRLFVREGVLYRHWVDDEGVVVASQLITPHRLRRDVMVRAHDHQLAGHAGQDRTMARLRPHFYWSGMTVDVAHWLQSCEVCHSHRSPPSRPHHNLERQVISTPNQRVTMDILGPFNPLAQSGYRYMLVMMDCASKWIEAVPMVDMTAETCAHAFVHAWVLRLGPPEQLLTDRGSQFESAMFQELCTVLGVDKLRTTALHPQCDGQTERANRTILALLNKTAVDSPRNWDVRLPYAVSTYRSSVHRMTQCTPNMMMLGREVSTPLSLLVPAPPRAPVLQPWVQQLKENMEGVHRAAVEHVQATLQREQPHLDRRSRHFKFETGEKVWLYTPKQHKGVSRKMSKQPWSGWWVIVKVVSACVYTIQYRDTRRSQTVNVDRLRPYTARSEERFPPLQQHTSSDSDSDDDSDSQLSVEEDEDVMASAITPNPMTPHSYTTLGQHDTVNDNNNNNDEIGWEDVGEEEEVAASAATPPLTSLPDIDKCTIRDPHVTHAFAKRDREGLRGGKSKRKKVVVTNKPAPVRPLTQRATRQRRAPAWQREFALDNDLSDTDKRCR